MNTTQNNGFEFLDFIEIKEEDIKDYAPVAGSFAVISCDDKVLMVYNVWREQWELPAGRREGNETERECAVRELYEETGQHITELEFKGLLKLKNTADSSVKHNPVFAGSAVKLVPFLKNDETSEMKLWDRSGTLGVIDEMDLKILDFV
ncbi:DNA mismatch repair protein MutT [Planococcus salinarum]|uniref:DNA mismatch repair protein MutT n=1 Tax=Planococcus salinarum TaxID=622695 RepID=A0ABX3CTJ6_9BACL|nr:NUDIX hydrolase [Planococcus salinarum]OHX48576.1 DNA mismatch repair protein MutT [Planococcus salinarum]TAA69208.1 NUDIX hydrolase [Planococcus salinarum]